ncbi:MAG: FtsK/SpoIIIE domain-containing protein [Anaerotignum propionicum]|nr:FtsK/SpoIIIE domain-containing protein [Anaerotignum propionicum]
MKINAISDKKTSLLETSLLAILGGAASTFLYPAYAVYGCGMAAMGVCGIAYTALTWSRFDKLWQVTGLCVGSSYPLKKGAKKTDISTIYTFTLPCGLSVQDFDKKKKTIEQYLGREIEIKYTYKEIQIEVFEQRSVTIQEYQPTIIKGNVPIMFGYDRKGNLITADLSDGEPHLLIAGETGSGKSTALRCIITNLILNSDTTLHLIDLKRGAEFNVFAKSSKVKSFSRTKEEAEDVLGEINNEIDRRYDLFFDGDVADIKEYNRKFPRSKLDYQIIIIDEFADLQNEKASINILETIAAKARACGIHGIFSTQRPDAKVLNGRIKANVSSVLGLKTMNDTNSRIIIDHNGLEALRGKGHGLFKRGSETELQCPYLSVADCRELIKHTYVYNKVENINTPAPSLEDLGAMFQ